MPPSTADLRKQWGKAVKTRREALSLSQSALAELVGVQKETIYRIERGVFAGSEQTQMAIAQALDVPVHKLFSFELAEEAS